MSDRRFAVLGHPIGHTMSPYIHTKLFTLSGREDDYGVLDITPDRLERAAGSVLTILNGYNVTIPYKQAIIPFLDALDEKAARYGSVNTVYCGEKTIGSTTDPDGLLMALHRANMPLSGRVVVLGAGGAARVMAYEAALAGCDVTIAVRESGMQKARALCKEIAGKTDEARVSMCALSEIAGDIDLMMNATPVGMYPNTQEMPVGGKALSGVRCLFDSIYNPETTRLMKAAQANGTRVLGGMPMLVWQAAAAHRIWDNDQYDPRDIDALCADATGEMNRRFAAR